MAKITRKEEKFLRDLRTRGILTQISPEKVKASNGAIVVTCSDADQIDDVLTQQKKINRNPRIHCFALNGGALLLDPQSSLCQELGENHILLRHIKTASQIKGILTLIIYAHAPCGAAHAHSLSIEEVINQLVRATENLKEALPDFQIIPNFHIHWLNGSRRSYFLDIPKWKSFRLC